MKNLQNNELNIVVEEKSDEIIITWQGKCRERDPASFLIPYFDEILKECNGRKLIVDFSTLKYMNSSTVHPIVDLIKKLGKKNIEADIFYSKAVEWQYSSFKALNAVAQNLKNVSITGK